MLSKAFAHTCDKHVEASATEACTGYNYVQAVEAID